MKYSELELLTPAQTVIYTQDMEPITTIRMRPEWWRHLEKVGRINFEIIEPLKLNESEYFSEYQVNRKMCEITGHVISNAYLRSKYILMTTDDETEALLLEPDFLPGQQRKFNEEKLSWFIRGFTTALTRTK